MPLNLIIGAVQLKMAHDPAYGLPGSVASPPTSLHKAVPAGCIAALLLLKCTVANKQLKGCSAAVDRQLQWLFSPVWIATSLKNLVELEL